MAQAGDAYSRLVSWLKILLPLIALAILSTLFLVSRSIDPSQSLPYSDTDVEGLAREQRIGAPAYSGTTLDGAAITVSAKSARPDDGGKRMTADAPSARVELPGGRSLTIDAAGGSIDQTSGVATLQGRAVIATSDGYRLETDSVTARLDRTLVEADGPVDGTAPFGSLVADRMVLSETQGDGYVLRFEGGVKLIYRPGA